jgi:hypothetical protein
MLSSTAPAPLGSMNGTWILDKSRGQPSMRGYLETMGVTPLAIEAHEKGEEEHDTINIIEFTDNYFSIKKMSRVNDLSLELTLGEEVRLAMPGDRIKTIMATSDHPGQDVTIVSRMPTMNGIAHVIDEKTLVREHNLLVLVQKLTIKNELNGNSNTTIRYFVPYQGDLPESAITAKGPDGKPVKGGRPKIADDSNMDEEEP